MTGLKRTLRSRRGFTLVELVVVLVIAGITASFAVPALTGYIDNAARLRCVWRRRPSLPRRGSLWCRTLRLREKAMVQML